MSHCQAAVLSDRAVLSVTGADARKFLQGVITSDINKVDQGHAIHTGLLSPQGKILFDFFVVAVNDGFLIDVVRAKAAELVTRLGFYRLRAAVEIAEQPGFEVAAVWGGAPNLPDGAIAFADPRLPELGMRTIAPSDTAVSALGCDAASEAEYHALRIKLGVPEGGRDYAFGETFPHEALFDQLNGVDFHKGCFVGQEVVSRMEHRGTARSRIVPVVGDSPLTVGAEVAAGGLPLGSVGSVAGTSGLAMIRLDRAGDAAARGTPLLAGDIAITLCRPPFATFAVPSKVSS